MINKHGEEKEIRPKDQKDPEYELTSDEADSLGFEWVFEDDGSGIIEDRRELKEVHPYGGYSIRGNSGQRLYEPDTESPPQSNADFLRRPLYNEMDSPMPHHQRAFDFSLSLRDIGDVHPNFGGQAPHWLGTPQFSLTKVNNQVEALVATPQPSDQALIPSEVSIDQAENFSVNIGNRPPSPESFIRIPLEEKVDSESVHETFSDVNFNPWDLAGHDYLEVKEETASNNGQVTDDEKASSNPVLDYEQIAYNGIADRSLIGEYFEEEVETNNGQVPDEEKAPPNTALDYEQMAYNESSPNTKHPPYEDYPQNENVLRDGPYREDHRNPRYKRQYEPIEPLEQPNEPITYWREETRPAPSQSHQPYVVDPHDISRRGRTPIGLTQDQESPQYYQPSPSRKREPTLFEEAILRQISELHKQLDLAYVELERSEIEKRRLIQQLSYLRLMELELEELQALNRIVTADVPAEEDIEILDKIIYKIRGPRFPP